MTCAALPGFSARTGEETNTAVTLESREGHGRHNGIVAAAKGASPGVVFVGDSITEQWNQAGNGVWNEQFADFTPFNAGISADRTGHVLWRIENGAVDFNTSPKVCVLLIGTNNTGQRNCGEDPKQTAKGIAAICTKLTEKHPKMKILVLGILPRGETKADPMRVHNSKINKVLAGMKLPNVTFLDISSSFLDKKGNLSREISPDLLHLNEKGYAIFADAITPSIKKLYNN